MSADLFADTSRLIVDSANTLEDRFRPFGVLSFDLGRCWEALVEPIDQELTRRKEYSSAALMGSIEDGLHVLTFGIGQIIKQSRDRDAAPRDLQVRRAVAAQGIFEIISHLPSSEASVLEDSLGFRSHTFTRPKYPLSMYGVSVHAPEYALPKTSSTKRCPFRKSMAKIYPAVSEAIAKSVVTPRRTV